MGKVWGRFLKIAIIAFQKIWKEFETENADQYREIKWTKNWNFESKDDCHGRDKRSSQDGAAKFPCVWKPAARADIVLRIDGGHNHLSVAVNWPW